MATLVILICQLRAINCRNARIINWRFSISCNLVTIMINCKDVADEDDDKELWYNLIGLHYTLNVVSVWSGCGLLLGWRVESATTASTCVVLGCVWHCCPGECCTDAILPRRLLTTTPTEWGATVIENVFLLAVAFIWYPWHVAAPHKELTSSQRASPVGSPLLAINCSITRSWAEMRSAILGTLDACPPWRKNSSGASSVGLIVLVVLCV